jgi:hypothetical protein
MLQLYLSDVCDGDPLLNRCDAFLRFLELDRATHLLLSGDQGFGDCSHRSLLYSMHRIAGGEGPGGEGGAGVDVARELAADGISLTGGARSLAKSKAQLMKEEEDRVTAERDADFRRPNSPRPNNLDVHGGFVIVNANPLLRQVGASIGTVDDVSEGALTSPPAPLEGQLNFYHTPLGSRYLRQHVEEHVERGKLREVLLYNRLWRHVPLPLAKDMFALLWHCGALTLWPPPPIAREGDAATRRPEKVALVDTVTSATALLDHKAAIVFRVDVKT